MESRGKQSPTKPLQIITQHGKLGTPIEHVVLTCSILKPAYVLP